MCVCMPVQYSTAVLTIISDICACAVNTNMTVLRTQRPLSFYVHLVTLSLSHADVVVHYHMFDNNGNYKEYSASEVDWSKADKKMCTVEGMAARSLANACANITKRAWSDMGAPLRHLFNSGAGPEASELLGVQQGQVPWTHEQLHFDTKQKNMPQAQREVLMHWCCFDSALGDTAAGFVSQESLQNRQNKNHAEYAPFGTQFAAYMIENVLTKVEYGMADVLLPPEEYKGTMTPAELKIKVAELLQGTHASFTVEAEQRCLARFYDVDAWAALTDEEKASTHDYTVVNAKMMTGFNVCVLASETPSPIPLSGRRRRCPQRRILPKSMSTLRIVRSGGQRTGPNLPQYSRLFGAHAWSTTARRTMRRPKWVQSRREVMPRTTWRRTRLPWTQTTAPHSGECMLQNCCWPI